MAYVDFANICVLSIVNGSSAEVWPETSSTLCQATFRDLNTNIAK